MLAAPKKYPEEIWEHLADDYRRLGSRRAVAELYGCSESLVEKQLHKRGVPRFPKHQAMVNHQRSTQGRRAVSRRTRRRYQDKPKGVERPTPCEKLVAAALDKVRLGFEFQQRFNDGRYIVDFALTDYPVVIEADGWHHTRFQTQIDKDRERDAWLGAHGHTVFRLRNDDIKADADECVGRVTAFVRQKIEVGEWSVAPARRMPKDWGRMRGPRNPSFGRKHSEESRRRQSESRKRRYREDPEFAERMRRQSTETSRTPEHRTKMRDLAMGNQHHKGHFKRPRP